MFILILLSVFWILYKGIHFIYLFEEKKYRLDRFQLGIADHGFISQFYTYRITLPSRTPRNFMIVAFHFLVTGVLFLYAFEDVYMYNFLSYFFWIAPFVAFIIILTAVVLTQIPVQMYRWIIIQTAKIKIRNSKTIFIGITGSYGKSTIARILYDMFSQEYAVAMTDSRYTNDIGIARSILRNLTDDTEVFIVEIESYRKGELKQAAQYIPFTYFILTGIGNHRYGLFGSSKAMHAEFTSLLPTLSDTAKAYIHSDIPEIPNTKAQIIRYGFSEKDDIYPTHYDFSQTYTKARIHYKKHFWNISTALLGQHSLLNILPVFAVCSDFGVPSSQIVREIKDLKHDKDMFSVHRGIHKSVIIVDFQEPNLDGICMKLDFLKHFTHKRKFFVLAELEELGVEKRSSYDKIIHTIHKYNIDLYTTDSLFLQRKKEARVFTFNDVLQLQRELLLSVDKGTVVLVEGKWPPSLTEALIVHK